MLHSVRNCLKKRSLALNPAYFMGGGSKRKPTKKDLDKYDVIWIGGNLAGICSRHFDEVVHGKYAMMSVFDNSVN